MKTLMLSTLAVLASASFGSAAIAQDMPPPPPPPSDGMPPPADPAGTGMPPEAPPAPPPPVQEQANPQGSGQPTATPPDPATANDPVPPAQPADPNYNAGPYKGALTAPPPQEMNKTYPVCTKKIQDSCRNPGGR